MSDCGSARVRERTYLKNEKELAARLMREKPEGLAGLQFVLIELRLAQGQGLIHERKESMKGKVGKFANIL
jgi:hypothetical protein